jgi:serine phosphatase RsbU (regulator of sigma subunit)
MMRSKAAIQSTVGPTLSPAEVLEKVNQTLCEGNETDMFVTVWLGIVNLSTGRMLCANAGHEYPVLRKKGQDYELLKDRHSLALGTIEGIRFKEYELQLEPGDELFVYTDGIPESINKDVEQYGTDRLLKVLNNNKDIQLERLLPRIRNDISNFCGQVEQFDDITMLGFKFKAEKK